MERLQKEIAERGYCSRRKAEKLILDGKVSVNGLIVEELGFKVNKEDFIVVDGQQLIAQNKVVYILNKPKGVISSAKDDRKRVCVCDLIDSQYRLFPIGRLDYDSTGLILLSNDGALMQAMCHPKYEVEKAYKVTIDGLLSQEICEKICSGVKIDNYVSSPCKIENIVLNNNKKQSTFEITIHEGKNREIRKMFATFGYEVLKLQRIKEANIELGTLQVGKYRQLKPFEVKKLWEYLNTNHHN